MKLVELKLKNYRNYSDANVAFSDITVFTGDNAQGKTNVLEAAFLCSTGRSHRTRKDKELIKMGESGLAVTALVEKTEGLYQIDYRLDQEAGRKILINGMPIKRMGELMGVLNTVLFAPEDLDLVEAGPAERRRFMDMELSQVQPSYFYSLQAYQRILRQRNALLHSGQDLRQIEPVLSVWDEQLIKEGCAIIRTRKVFLERLAIKAGEIHSHLSGNKEELVVTYQPDIVCDGEDVEAAFRKRLEQVRETELRRQTSCAGPHRDDIHLEINGLEAKVYGSQGQKRTAALALKLSEISLMEEDIGEKPVLLLDDVLSELDISRQQLLFSYMENTQTVLTCTHLEGGQRYENALTYTIKNGTVNEA